MLLIIVIMRLLELINVIHISVSGYDLAATMQCCRWRRSDIYHLLVVRLNLSEFGSG